MERLVVAATDGSCSPNPGPGGWAWVTDDGRQGSGAAAESTNNRMELRAVVGLLRAMPPSTPLLVLSDSDNLVRTFNEWLVGWKAKAMRTKKGPVKNADLILEIDALRLGRDVTFRWVKAHDGHALNEMADALANDARAAGPDVAP